MSTDIVESAIHNNGDIESLFKLDLRKTKLNITGNVEAGLYSIGKKV